MKTKIVDKTDKEIIEEYDSAERRVYSKALANFRQGETYRNTPDPMRTALQHDYARFMVECFRREKINSRSHALRF